MDEVAQRVRADIEQYGWHIGKIPGDERAPSWAFSIGFWQTFGHPEVAVFGLDLETGHRLLNQVGLALKQGARFTDGQRSAGILEGHDVGFREIAACWLPVFLGNISWFYTGEEVPGLQCFWPDPVGRLPWDEGFDDSLHVLQPLLFETDVTRALTADFAALLRDEGALE